MLFPPQSGEYFGAADTPKLDEEGYLHPYVNFYFSTGRGECGRGRSFEGIMTDTYRHKGLRKKLVQEIAAMGVTDQRVLDAMNKVPRHFFLSSAFLEFAYENKAFQIGAGQTISQPFTVGFQSQLLQVEPGMKVLEIGTGSGYQTSVLCELGAKVFSVERQKVLHDNARVILRQMGYKAHLTYGDGYKGMPAFAPFDLILIT